MGGAHDVRRLRQEVGNAIAWGLPRDAALRAVTATPAEVFGLGREYGQLTRGQVANVVVWNGDPFELSTFATHVIVRGRMAPMTSRQDALLARYRELSTVRRGHPGRAREAGAE
jgi:imidazolonepropionase-like amidohydrolase